MVSQAVGHFLRPCVKEEEPCFRIFNGLDELISLKVLLLYAGMIGLNSNDGLSTLFGAEEMGRDRTPREENPDHDTIDDGQTSGNY